MIRRVQERDQRARHARGRRRRRLGPPGAPRRSCGDGAWIDYAGPAGHVPRCTFSDVGAGRGRPRGRSATRSSSSARPRRSLQDIHPVSWPRGPHARARGPRERDRDAARRRRRCASRRRGVDIALALLLGAASRRSPALAAPRVARAGDHRRAGGRSTSSPRSCCSTRADRARGRAAGGAGDRASSARCCVFWLSATFERARTRDVFARFVPDAGRRPGAHAGDGGGRPAPGRRADGRDGHVQRPARLHDLRRGARARAGDRDPQPLPHGDERRDPRPRRHARRLHGRRDHGRVRRAGRGRRPPGPRARRRAGDARPARRSSTPGCASAGSATASRWASGCTPGR